MKTSGLLIFYISENEDFELWKALSQIPPDERASYVKTVLNKALTNANQKSTGNYKQSGSKQYNNNFNTEKNIIDNGLNNFIIDEVTYSSGVATDETVIKPLQYLFNNAIGSENDKNLIKAPKSTNTNSSSETHFELLQLDELYSQSQSAENSLPGLDFLLNNVIGEENDEKVIEFIKNRKRSSK